jgi:hypothetical protein
MLLLFEALPYGLNTNPNHILGDADQTGMDGLIYQALLLRTKLNGHKKPPPLFFHPTSRNAMHYAQSDGGKQRAKS